MIKLGDFGIARILSHTLSKVNTMIGTPYNMSPEICKNEVYSFKTDIWSLGIILYEMCALRKPFNAKNLACLAIKISRGSFRPIPNHYTV